MIEKLTITVFLTQLVFIFCRTWNVKSISNHNVKGALVSGAIVHIAWLVSISIGAVSMSKIMIDFNFDYLPVILGSLAGGLLGTYSALQGNLYNRLKAIYKNINNNLHI